MTDRIILTKMAEAYKQKIAEQGKKFVKIYKTSLFGVVECYLHTIDETEDEVLKETYKCDFYKHLAKVLHMNWMKELMDKLSAEEGKRLIEFLTKDFVETIQKLESYTSLHA